jgi:hypothetical protein
MYIFICCRHHKLTSSIQELTGILRAFWLDVWLVLDLLSPFSMHRHLVSALISHREPNNLMIRSARYLPSPAPPKRQLGEGSKGPGQSNGKRLCSGGSKSAAKEKTKAQAHEISSDEDGGKFVFFMAQ